jgi:hypothetical protein
MSESYNDNINNDNINNDNINNDNINNDNINNNNINNDVIDNDVFIDDDDDEITNNNIDLNLKLNKKNNFIDYVFIIKEYTKLNNVNNEINLDLLLKKISTNIQSHKHFIDVNIDSIYILLFSSLLLYDDLMDDNITKKMTKNQFCIMLNKCNNGDNYDVKLLHSIYIGINKKIKRIKSQSKCVIL